MLGGLTTSVDPILLADQNQRITGRVPVHSMARLRAQLLDDSGEVDVDLNFERSEGAGVRRMHGRLTARVAVGCQRCLEPMTIQVVAEPDTILLRGDESERGVPPETDVLTVAASMTIADLIEDDLLLAMPMVPMHPLEQCPARTYMRRPE